MEYEVKYSFLNHRADFVRRLVSARFQVDQNYPVGVITSIYYDTKDMLFYEEKRASTYRKRKFRLRWYLNPETRQPDEQAFWEVKSRIGTQRSKTRNPANLLPAQLEQIKLDDPALLKEAITQQRGIPGPQIFPSVMIRYTRHRYIDSVNGSRINIDSDIHARRISSGLANERSLSCLPVAVLEYKGEHDVISPVLADLGLIGLKKEAFSKYESAIKWVKSNQQLF